jgi:Raf kinase inhibitor-like YbhB/YbcL family protein
MKISSPAFEHNGTIPVKYTQYGDNVNPPLIIEDVPDQAQSLTLIVDDPDVPEQAGVLVWDHWVVYNIEPTMTSITEHWEVIGDKGQGTAGNTEYAGPKPPDREHRYFFKVYALDCVLDLPIGATKAEVEQAMAGHILETAEFVGKFAPLA